MLSRRRGCLWFAGGLLLALAAAAVVFVTMQGATRTAEAPQEAPKVPVLVAARDVPVHTVLSAADVTVREVPPDMVPSDALKDPADALGQLSMEAIAQGEIVLARRLIAPDYVGPATAFVMDPGQLVVAIPASDLLGSLDVIRPGDRVDVLLTYDFAKSKARIETGVNTLTVMPNVRIAAVMRGPAGEGGTPGPARAFLLALEAEDALTLKHLRDMGGAVDLALRSPAAPDTPFTSVVIDGDYLLQRYQIHWRAVE